MKTSTCKQFTSRREPNEHTLQEHIIISGVFVRRGGKKKKPWEEKKNLFIKEDLQFEIIPAILELQRT